MCSLCNPKDPEAVNRRLERKYYHEAILAKTAPLRELAAKREWKLLGEGSFRKTYLSPSGKFVYKVPTGSGGIRSNEREHEIFRKRKRGGHNLAHEQYARCRLSKSGILVMELVKPSTHCLKGHNSERVDEIAPEWVNVVDTGQAGKNRDGNWVIFDYGNE